MEREMRELTKLFTGAVETIVDCGGVIMRWRQRGVGLEALTEVSGLPFAVMRGLERVGRGEWDPRLMVSPWPAGEYLRRLPYGVHSGLIDSEVEVVEMDEESRDVRRLKVSALTVQQCRQVFDARGVRSADEQAAWISAQREKARQDAMVKSRAKPEIEVVPGQGNRPGHIVVAGVKIDHRALAGYVQQTA